VTLDTAAVPDVGRNASPYLYGPEDEAVLAALHTGQYGHTEITERFEAQVAEFLGVSDAVAVASGTAALHIALLAAGLGPAHEVIVPSMTFCATIQAIRACGARPVFIEINPDTLCIEPVEVLAAITPATRAVMPVLYGGRAVDLTAIHHVLAERGILIIEDAAHAFGSHCGNRRVGATGALTCFSFGPIKNLTCTQGGMIIPADPQQASAARRLRGLGITQSAAQRAASTSYTVDDFGMRAQMPALNAAIGTVQLAHFTTAEATRKQLWRTYQAALTDVEGATLIDVDVEHSVPSLCAVRVPARDQVFHLLRERGVGVGVHYPPNHLQPAFARWHRSLPVTETIGQQIMTLPFHQHLTDRDIQHVVTQLERALATVRAVR
jgi:dTDP-4-amino-4,6-dideoxygalactose transaminase